MEWFPYYDIRRDDERGGWRKKRGGERMEKGGRRRGKDKGEGERKGEVDGGRRKECRN